MSSEPSQEPASADPPPEARSDLSAWYWLLLVPLVVPLLTFLYNSDSPRFIGFPAFYWIQFAFIPLGVCCTAIVYFKTRKRG